MASGLQRDEWVSKEERETQKEVEGPTEKQSKGAKRNDEEIRAIEKEKEKKENRGCFLAMIGAHLMIHEYIHGRQHNRGYPMALTCRLTQCWLIGPLRYRARRCLQAKAKTAQEKGCPKAPSEAALPRFNTKRKARMEKRQEYSAIEQAEAEMTRQEKAQRTGPSMEGKTTTVQMRTPRAVIIDLAVATATVATMVDEAMSSRWLVKKNLKRCRAALVYELTRDYMGTYVLNKSKGTNSRGPEIGSLQACIYDKITSAKRAIAKGRMNGCHAENMWYKPGTQSVA